MTQEEKELLLKDLCARLPYGIKGTVEIEVSTGEYSIESGHLLFMEKKIDVELHGINKDIEEIEVYPLNDNFDFNEYDYIIDDFINFIPYLRPMSSMTEEEKNHISKMMCLRTYDDGVVYDMTYPVYTPYYVMEDCLSYLRSIHMDYSGLIEKGLALEAPEGMYN